MSQDLEEIKRDIEEQRQQVIDWLDEPLHKKKTWLINPKHAAEYMAANVTLTCLNDFIRRIDEKCSV